LTKNLLKVLPARKLLIKFTPGHSTRLSCHLCTYIQVYIHMYLQPSSDKLSFLSHKVVGSIVLFCLFLQPCTFVQLLELTQTRDTRGRKSINKWNMEYK
jgi:hypothetical protein